MIHLLPWDTEFFGFQTGKAEIAELEKQGLEKAKALADGYRLVYLFCPLEPQKGLEVPSHISAFAQSLEAKTVDTKVVFWKTPTEPEPGVPIFEGVEEWQPEMGTEKLYELAFQSGEFSRFKTDKKFPDGTFERMYKQWVDNSLNGELAKKVFVARVNNDIAGFITLNLTSQTGKVGLIAVDPQFRGQRFGTKLMQKAMQYTLKENRKVFHVATQAENKAACTFYEKLGLKVVEAVKVYHWWV